MTWRKKRDKCDKIWARIIRSKGYCEKCGKPQMLQAAHLISRRHLKTRHDLDNGICLCIRHHIFWGHKEPDEFVDFIRELRGKDIFEELRTRSREEGKIDWDKRLSDLEEIESRIP